MPPRHPPPDDWIDFVLHIGTEMLFTVEILHRLRGHNDTITDMHEKHLQFLRRSLRSTEKLAASLTDEELQAIREHWEGEVAEFGRIVWAKYADTMWARLKRWRAQEVMERFDDTRIEARRSHAARVLGLAGGDSIKKLMAGKKAQGGIHDLDARLMETADFGEWAQGLRWMLGRMIPLPQSEKLRRRQAVGGLKKRRKIRRYGKKRWYD